MALFDRLKEAGHTIILVTHEREIADHARELTGSEGPAGVSRLMSIAHWLQNRK